ncbi:MAG: hypothetical protein EOM83_03460 [Clostridia bacterium]|nr:hypothetical protein [Clostridia bacterium]
MTNVLINLTPRSVAHGLLQSDLRLTHGGKFEHGFLSGFVSSLGGSAMIKYGANMDISSKVALSAALGGTAEVLGGGKFTGAPLLQQGSGDEVFDIQNLILFPQTLLRK